MISRLAGAIFRAILVMTMIAIPSLILPTTPSDAGLLASFLALCAAALIVSEYTSAAPSFVEFRDAPPFNRLRFATLLAVVFTLSLVLANAFLPTTLTRLAVAIASALGDAMDFPLSPVRLLLTSLPAGSAPDIVMTVRDMAGTAYLLSLLGIAVFLMTIRTMGWPAVGHNFNIWVNLPTFEPAAHGDLLWRLNRAATLNMFAGFLLPFAAPTLVRLSHAIPDPVLSVNPHSLIWLVTGWSVLPAALFMRGLALHFVAQSIATQRADLPERVA